MNLSQNQVLTNVFAKDLITNASTKRFARLSFVDLVSATVQSKTFQRAIKPADSLFGISADENQAVSRKVKHANKSLKPAAKHAKKQHNKFSKEVTMSDTDTHTPKRHRGRPKGS